jgi:acyl-homoserine lactone acylase PvdQ
MQISWKTSRFIATALSSELILPFHDAVVQLKKHLEPGGRPGVELNRYQRIGGNHDEHFNDGQPSFPMAWTHSVLGCLPAFASSYFPGTHKRYGEFGNSFICAVEFGKKIMAKSLLTGGESGHPDSKHFADQAQMYAEGKFKNVLFYKEDILKSAERTYHPGE